MTDHNQNSLSCCLALKHDQRPVARALFSYLASGENQLTFHEHDRIALVGDRANGWQFGENLRTQLFGWFPIAYTEIGNEETESNWSGGKSEQNGQNGQRPQQKSQQQQQQQQQSHQRDSTPESSTFDTNTLIEEEGATALMTPSNANAYPGEQSPTRMFGDTIMYRHSKQFLRVANGGTNGLIAPGPPPTLPAPVPSPIVPSSYMKSHLSQSHSFSTNGGPALAENRKSLPATTNFSKQVCVLADGEGAKK